MTALKIVGVIVGAWLVLGFLVIGPAQNSMPKGPGGAYILGGLAVVLAAAGFLIRRIVRNARRS